MNIIEVVTVDTDAVILLRKFSSFLDTNPSIDLWVRFMGKDDQRCTCQMDFLCSILSLVVTLHLNSSEEGRNDAFRHGCISLMHSMEPTPKIFGVDSLFLGVPA